MNKLSKLLRKLLQSIKPEIKQNRGVFYVVIFALLALIPLGARAISIKENPKIEETTQVLGVESEVSTAPPTLTLTPTPRPTTIPRVRIVSIAAPTPTPMQTSTPTPTQAQSSNSESTPTNTPTPAPTLTPTPTPTLTLTPTPTPTPNGLNIEISIDYAGQKPSDSYTVTVDSEQTAWEAVKSAVGIENLQYTDYGGDLGIFISGFNGILAASNQYYEFRINGVSSNVGVSSYTCNNEDKLEFVLTAF